MNRQQPSIWSARAERLLETALYNHRSGLDALPEIGAAETALRIDAGECRPDAMDGYPFPGEDEDMKEDCACRSGVRARGGFSSRCPAHGNRGGSW